MWTQLERKTDTSNLFRAMNHLQSLGAGEIETEEHPTEDAVTVLSFSLPKGRTDDLPNYLQSSDGS